MAMGNQTLGRGEVHFSRFKAGTQTPEGFRYVGNSPEFGLTIETEFLSHFSSDRGIRVEDKKIPLETTRTGNLVLDDIQMDNLALFFFGEKATLSQTSSTGVTETIADVIPGRSYQIGVSDSVPTGVREISNLVVEVGATTHVVEDDYTVDLELGIITILDTGDIAEGDDIELTYDRAARSRDQVISGTLPVDGALRFISYNPEGDKVDYYMPYCQIAPNGDFPLKSDEWQQMPFTVSILTATNPAREAIYADGRPYVAS